MGEEEKAARIRFGLNMVKSFVAGKEESEVTLIDVSFGLSSLLEKQAEEFSWTIKHREDYNIYAPGYQAAIEQGLVEVALPPWHPQISNLRAMLPIPPQPVAAAAVDAADAVAGDA